jgi:HK97 family phage prohead protease
VDKKEIRYLPVEQIEIRSGTGDGEMMSVGGYVVKFNQRSGLIWGEFYERVAQGAFAKSLRDNTIKALWNHNSDLVLVSTKNGTLQLEEDEIGLRFSLDLPDTSWGRDAFASIQRGDVDGVSFGFCVRSDSWAYLPDEDVYERTLLDVNLFEVSPTPFPAYPDSEVAQRSLSELGIKTKEQRRLEQERTKRIAMELDLLAMG